MGIRWAALLPSTGGAKDQQHTAAAKSIQSCPTLCDAIDGSPPGSPVPGILQARTLEWVAISFSNAWKWKSPPYCIENDSIMLEGVHTIEETMKENKIR